MNVYAARIALERGSMRLSTEIVLVSDKEHGTFEPIVTIMTDRQAARTGSRNATTEVNDSSRSVIAWTFSISIYRSD